MCALALHPIALTLLLSACDAGAIAGDPAGASQGGVVGGLVGDAALVHEPGQGGLARELHLADVRWGRRVDVFDLDLASGERSLVLEGFVAGPGELGQGVDVELAGSLAGAGTELTILHARGSDAFERVLERLERGLAPLAPGALGAALEELPRNAALVLRFDDLIDPATVSGTSVELVADGRPVEVSVTASHSHGILVDGTPRSTRLVVDLGPSLAAHPGAEVELRLALGVGRALANLGGAALVPSTGQPIAATGVPALVHTFRAGSGPSGVLDDSVPPFVVGTLPGQLTKVTPLPQAKVFLVDYLFSSAPCAFAPQRGDVLETTAHLAEVLGAPAPPVGGQVSQMRVRVRSGDPATFLPGPCVLRARWTQAVTAPPECFVTLLPQPVIAPATGASTASVARIAFSEPMDPASVLALDTFRLAYGKPHDPSPLAAHVVGAIAPSAGLDRFTFQPALPLRHSSGVSERYFVELSGGPQGVRDLAGNALGFDLPTTSFLVLRTEPTQDTGSLSLSFGSPDEDGDGAPELRGQIHYDPVLGAIRGRDVTRFSSVADDSQPLIGAMIPFSSALRTPLQPLGAKLMSVWRYCDLGFGLLDEDTHNLDVEGLAWAPFGMVQPDRFSAFRMALAHARWLPDEVVGPALLPSYRQSGLVPTYADNLLSASEDPLTVVHDKAKGYRIDPLDLFTTPSGTSLMPWPMNRGVPPSQYVTWTWRDTAKLARGAPQGAGADPKRLGQATGNTALQGFYPADEVPTIGLPLLTEYRCYPDPNASGINGFKTSFALNSSYKPTFRAYSAGGIGPSGTKLVDPDLEPVATGGVNPVTGAPTLPIDNTLYWGQADFVVRVSRAHTRWLDTGAAASFAQALLETELPLGTQVVAAFRGASSLSAAAGQPWVDATNLGPYGDSYTDQQLILLQQPTSKAFTVQHFPTAGDPSWSTTLPQIDGARYVQVRLSFAGNWLTLGTPRLTGLGIAFRR